MAYRSHVTIANAERKVSVSGYESAYISEASDQVRHKVKSVSNTLSSKPPKQTSAWLPL